jgi:hypothetical protein
VAAAATVAPHKCNHFGRPSLRGCPSTRGVWDHWAESLMGVLPSVTAVAVSVAAALLPLPASTGSQREQKAARSMLSAIREGMDVDGGLVRVRATAGRTRERKGKTRTIRRKRTMRRRGQVLVIKVHNFHN